MNAKGNVPDDHYPKPLPDYAAVSVKRADEERGHPTYQTTLKMVKLTDHKYSPNDTEKVN